MNISESLSRELEYHLFSENASNYRNTHVVEYYQDHNVFKKFMEIKVSDGNNFIPVIGMKSMLKYIDLWLQGLLKTPIDSINFSIPLYVLGSEEKKTGEAIFKAINGCSISNRLTKVCNPTGLGYYGGNGLIFDKQWDPLMVCGYIVNIDKEHKKYCINSAKCYVSPEVFTNNDVLSKFIIKKVIPYITTYGICTPLKDTWASCANFSSVETVICKSLYKFFLSPTIPNYTELDVDEDIWKFLEANKEEVYDS